MAGTNSIPTPNARVILPRWLECATLAIIVCATIAIRLRLLDMPLERDEGEYAYAGQLMLQGIPPYKLAYNIKLPGTYAAYALIMAVFGETIRGIHLGLILVNSVTTVLVYFLGRRLFGQICGLIAAASFAVLSLSHSVFGLAAHATHFVTLCAVAGTLLLFRAADSRRLTTVFSSGLLFGLAFVMKQPGIFFAFFGASFLAWIEGKRRLMRWDFCRRFAVFCAGAILPFTITCVVLVAAGVFQQFWFWTFSYANQYALNPSLWYSWAGFYAKATGILKSSPGLWLLAAIGLWLCFSNSGTRRAAWFTLAFSVTAFATAVPGFYFREHYFIPLLVGAALFIGGGVQVLCGDLVVERRTLARFAWPVCIFLLAISHTVFRQRQLFFQLSPTNAVRAIYGRNPFAESINIARYIQEHSAPGSRIAVFGSEPQIYFYSHRRSATGYIYTYGMMEPQPYALTMQREMIAEIEAARPDFLVVVHVPMTWLEKKGSSHQIFEWEETYARGNLRPVMLVDIESQQQTVYYSNETGVTAVPHSDHFIWVFRRTNSS